MNLPDTGISDSDNIITRLCQLLPSLTGAKARICRIVLSHLHESSRLTLQEISKKAGCSHVTVIRFCQSLGYKGFKDFYHELLQSTALEQVENVDSSQSTTLLETVRDAHISLLHYVSASVEKCLQKALDLIMNAEDVIWYGIGDSAFLAESGDHKFTIAGLSSKTAADPHTFQNYTHLLKENDVVICISHSGQTDIVLDPLRQNKHRPARLIAITGASHSELVTLADVALIIPGYSIPVGNRVITLRSSQLMIVDALVLGLLQRKGVEIWSGGI